MNGQFLCYERRDQCPAGECEASGPPHWHCFSMEGSKHDPLAGVKSCWPTLAMCTASRPQLEGVAVSDCAPVDSVYCETSSRGALSCFADEAGCRKTSELVSRTLKGLDAPKQPCTRRR